MKHRARGQPSEFTELLDGYDDFNDKHHELLKNFAKGRIKQKVEEYTKIVEQANVSIESDDKSTASLHDDHHRKTRGRRQAKERPIIIQHSEDKKIDDDTTYESNFNYFHKTMKKT